MKLVWELNESSAKDSKSQGHERPRTLLLGSASAYCGSTEMEAWCVRFPIFQENIDLQIVHVDSIYLKNLLWQSNNSHL